MKSQPNNSGITESLWMQIEFPAFEPLSKNLVTDICVVGAGISGLTCAYHLTQKGYSVAVIDQGDVGGGQTARTTAHLTWALDDRFFDLEKMFGIEGSQLAADSHAAAIDSIEAIVRKEKIECDFERVSGYLFAPPQDFKILQKEYKAIEKIGMPIEWAERAPFKSFDTGVCLHFPNQAQFHILKYLKGLIHAILGMGGQIFSHTHASKIEGGNPCSVFTSNGVITAKHVIVATCTPINDRFTMHTKQAAYRTYVIGAEVPKDLVPRALYWDTLDPYHYIRVQPHSKDSDWLLIGGEDHKTGQEKAIEEKYALLENWGQERFPTIKNWNYHWSGQVFEPVDSLAFIGKNPGDENIWIVTGDSGNGMTHGTIAGRLLPELIAGKEHPWKKLYDPSRKTFSAALEFMKENGNTFLQYRDWLTPGELKEVDDLQSEEGKILRKGIRKIAVYKDLEKKIHFHSAFCPHLGACLRWNSGEKSWDCPAHGSRFDAYGNLLNGPANCPLGCEEN